MATPSRGLNDRPVATRTFYNSGNASLTPPSNVKLSDPNKSTQTQQKNEFNLGNNIGAYFQSKNTQTPQSTGLQREYPTGNGISPRGGGASAIQAASQAAEGVGQGIQSSWNIGANASITNNWFNNISGVNGIYNGMHDRASIQAAAEQRGVDKVNNWANTGKAVAGPAGLLIGSLMGRGMSNLWTKGEINNANFKTLTDTDQNKIDPKNAAISTAKDKVDPVLARNVAYGPDNTVQRASPDSITRNSLPNNLQRMLPDPKEVQSNVALRNAMYGKEGGDDNISQNSMSWDGYQPGLQGYQSPDGSLRGLDDLPSEMSSSNFSTTTSGTIEPDYNHLSEDSVTPASISFKPLSEST